MSLKMTIDYPDTIPDALQETRKEFERNAKLAMFAKLFEMKKISSQKLHTEIQNRGWE